MVINLGLYHFSSWRIGRGLGSAPQNVFVCCMVASEAIRRIWQ